MEGGRLLCSFDDLLPSRRRSTYLIPRRCVHIAHPCVTSRLIEPQTRENIDRYCEKFEKDMLHLFDRAYRRGDPKMMHVCAFLHLARPI